MKQFIPIKNNSFSFSNCEQCEARCCDGRKGSTFSQIILDDFKKIYTNFPILFTFGDLGYLKPVVILSNGVNFCKYINNHKCTIYEQRPEVCRIYPLSINIDEKIYIDITCPAINSEEKNSSPIISQGQINKHFYNKTFENYQNKYIDTHNEFEKFNKKEDFSLAIKLNNIVFYKYNKESNNQYMKMHLQSLIHLQDKYFTNLN